MGRDPKTPVFQFVLEMGLVLVLEPMSPEILLIHNLLKYKILHPNFYKTNSSYTHFCKKNSNGKQSER